MRTIVCRWDGNAFVPLPTMIASCREHYKNGERYGVDVIEQRSMASHKQYMAAVGEAWANLSDDAVARYPDKDALRKWALIKAHYCDETTFILDSEEAAQRNAMFLRRLDSTAVVIVKGNIIRMYVAKSQSLAAMDKDEFEKSKRDVLDILSGTIGVTRTVLEREGRLAATKEEQQ